MKTPSLTKQQAERAGFRPVTHPCAISDPDSEVAAAERAIWQKLRRNFYGCNVVRVDTPSGPELWRHRDELDIDPENGTKIDPS